MKDAKQAIIHFWFEETKPQQWFQINPEFDEEIKKEIQNLIYQASDKSKKNILYWEIRNKLWR